MARLKKEASLWSFKMDEDYTLRTNRINIFMAGKNVNFNWNGNRMVSSEMSREWQPVWRFYSYPCFLYARKILYNEYVHKIDVIVIAILHES